MAYFVFGGPVPNGNLLVLRCQWLFCVIYARRWKNIAETCSSGVEWILRLRESTLKKILAFVMDLWETERHNLEICVLRSIIHEPERFCTARATVSVQRATMLRSMKKHLTWNYSDCVDIYFGVIPCLVTCVAKLSRDKVKPVYTDQQVHDPLPVSDRFLLNMNIYLYIRSITVSLWSSYTDHELLSLSGMRFPRVSVDVSAHFFQFL